MDKILRDYFFDDTNKTIFHMVAATREIGIPAHSSGLTYIGTSDNPNIKMAAQVFMRQGRCLTGCKIKEYSVE